MSCQIQSRKKLIGIVVTEGHINDLRFLKKYNLRFKSVRIEKVSLENVIKAFFVFMSDSFILLFLSSSTCMNSFLKI